MAPPSLKSANGRTFSQNHSYSMTKFYIYSLTRQYIKLLTISAGKMKLIGDTTNLMNMWIFQIMILGQWYIIKLVFCLMVTHESIFVITQIFSWAHCVKALLCRPWKFSLPANIFLIDSSFNFFVINLHNSVWFIFFLIRRSMYFELSKRC